MNSRIDYLETLSSLDDNWISGNSKKPDRKVIDNSKIVEIRGTEKLESIVLDKDNRELKVDGLFIEIASVPETGYLLNDLDVDKDGNVLAVYGMSTNKPGIFIAGDIRVKILKQVATAISDGATAAAQAIKYINEKKLK